MAAELIVNSTKMTLVKGDITLLKVDAIVNAANSGLMGGGGVDGAIHMAGGPAIVEECRVIVSKIGRLPAKYVIHTVGPVWRGGGSREAEVLASCYTESLKIAGAKELSSIAFPAISTGVYGYPPDLAAGVAVNAVTGYLKNNPTTLKSVQFVVYDGNALQIYTGILNSVKP